MKTLFVAFVALLFAFFIGCQSSITDPVSENTNMTGTTDDETFVYKESVSAWPGVIRFDKDICEPIHNTCNTTVIGGVIRYKVDASRMPYDTEPISKKVSIYINAEIKSGFGGVNGAWIVFGRTEKIVYLPTPNDQIYTFEKEFTVKNTGNFCLKLAVKFELVNKSVKLVSMILRKCAELPIGDPEL